MKESVLNYISKISSPVTVVEVAENLKIHPQTAKRVLLELAQEKKLNAKRSTKRIWIFWSEKP